MLISEKEQLLSELKSLRSSKDKTAREKQEIREQIVRLDEEIKGMFVWNWLVDIEINVLNVQGWLITFRSSCLCLIIFVELFQLDV